MPSILYQQPDEPRSGRSIHFSLSVPGSENSSRSSSPGRGNGNSELYPRSTEAFYPDTKTIPASLTTLKTDIAPGHHPMDVYEAILPWWRAAIRRRLVKTVQWESEVIARLQDFIRTPWLDAYFVYTSSLGTHTFFMILLPAFFFFGYSEMGRGLIIVLALGVYCSSFVKDLICSPRPFSPPVTRLTIGTHHLEYGFPSTHSTNCVSIALFFFGYVHQWASISSTLITPSLHDNSTASSTTSFEPLVSAGAYTTTTILLLMYTFSIVFGRIYTAMHSFTDCAVGVGMGMGIWWGHSSWSGIPVVLSSSNPLHWLYSIIWPSSATDAGTYIIYLGKGLGAGEWLETWVKRGGWEVPALLIPLGLLAVNQHPQPVDDCPCFEDAIAFGSVVLGALVGCWAVNYMGIGFVKGTTVMPGSGWVHELGQWVQVERTWGDVCIWWSFAALKMIIGILVIFIWRLLAKSTLHLILPPTFRGLARVFSLPNRRFYTPATDYKSVPSEFSTDSGGFGLRPIPSVIDLPSSAGVGIEVGGIGSGSGASGHSDFGASKIKMRGGMNSDIDEKGRLESGHSPVEEVGGEREDSLESKDDQSVKHYDADVLTKLVVYAGIAVLACEALPMMFELIGWGVHSSVY